MGARDWSLLIALSLLWGGTFLFVGVAVAQVPPFTIVLIRVGLAAFALHLVMGLAGTRLPLSVPLVMAFATMALVNNVIPFCLLVWGQTRIASGLAAILNAATPFFTVIVAHLATQDERLTAARLAGTVMGMAGVAVMIAPATGTAGLGGDILAKAACVGAALSYAVASLYGRRFRPMGVTALQTAAGQLTASTLLLLPVALVVDRPWTLDVPDGATLAALGALALLSTALAYILYFRILASAGATNLMLVTLLIPVTAVILGLLVLGERLGLSALAGMALIAVGLGVIDGRVIGWLRGLTRPPG